MAKRKRLSNERRLELIFLATQVIDLARLIVTGLSCEAPAAEYFDSDALVAAKRELSGLLHEASNAAEAKKLERKNEHL